MSWIAAAVGGGTALMGFLGSRNAASAQRDASNQQLQLGREQLALQERLYNNALGVGREVAGQQIGAARNTFQGQRGAANRTFGQSIDNANAYSADAFGLADRTRGQALNFANNQQSTGMGLARGVRNQTMGFADDQRNTGMGIARDTRNTGMDIAGDVRDRQVGQFQPYANSGGAANNALNYEMGLGGMPTGYRGFQETPGYEFMRGEATRAVDGSAAARGGLFSGATLAEMNRVGTGLADQEYDQFLNRLEGTRGMGMAAAGGIADAWGNYGANGLNIQNQYGATAQNINSDFGANRTNAVNNYGSIAQNVNADFGANRTNAANNYGATGQGIIGNTAGMVGGAIDARGQNIYNAIGGMGANIYNAYGGIGAGEANAGAMYSQGAGNAYNYQGDALANYGDASAAGAIGTTNAITNGIQQGVGIYAYNNPPKAATTARNAPQVNALRRPMGGR